MNDKCLIATAYHGQARIYVAKSTNLVEDARVIHGTWPTASAALGRFLTVSAMMGLMYKEEESITLRIEGDGPIGFMLVEANAKGDVRGDIKNPEVYLTYNSGPKEGKLAVGKAVGEGLLHVTKDLKMKTCLHLRLTYKRVKLVMISLITSRHPNKRLLPLAWVS